MKKGRAKEKFFSQTEMDKDSPIAESWRRCSKFKNPVAYFERFFEQGQSRIQEFFRAILSDLLATVLGNQAPSGSHGPGE